MWAFYAKIALDSYLCVERFYAGEYPQSALFFGFAIADVATLWIAMRSIT